MAVERRNTVVSLNIPKFNGENSSSIGHKCIYFSLIFVVAALCLFVPLIFIRVHAYHRIRCLCTEKSIPVTNQTLGEFALAKYPTENAIANLTIESEDIGDNDLYEFNSISTSGLSSNSVPSPIIARFNQRASYNKDLPSIFDKTSLNYTQEIENTKPEKNRDPRANDASAFLFDVIHRECQKTTKCIKCKKLVTTQKPIFKQRSTMSRKSTFARCENTTILCRMTTTTPLRKTTTSLQKTTTSLYKTTTSLYKTTTSLNKNTTALCEDTILLCEITTTALCEDTILLCEITTTALCEDTILLCEITTTTETTTTPETTATTETTATITTTTTITTMTTTITTTETTTETTTCRKKVCTMTTECVERTKCETTLCQIFRMKPTCCEFYEEPNHCCCTFFPNKNNCLFLAKFRTD